MSRRLGAAAALLALGGLALLAWPVARPASATAHVLARAAFAPTCHQRLERCLRVGEQALPACARCTGLLVGGLCGGLLLLLGAGRWRRPAVAHLLGLAGVLPAEALLGIAVAGWDVPLLRFATGVLAAPALLLLALPPRAAGDLG